MDFQWSTGVNNRDLFSYGPFIPSLGESRLSNHLGFNGLIESKDGYIPFIKRGKNVSIAKGTFATNIAASLKVKYALNKDKNFTTEGLKNAILQEIKDELKLEKNQLDSFDLQNNVIAAYRDLVEGGKPQLLVYAKSNLNKDEITKNFTNKRKAKKKNKFERNHIEFQVLEDGTSFMWIPTEDLNKIAFAAEYMVYQGYAYNMVPSTIASVYMIREHLQNIRRI